MVDSSCDRVKERQDVELIVGFIVLQSQDILMRKDPDKVPTSKRVVQNLRCSEVGGGLLDRTLITLISNAVSCSLLGDCLHYP